eukprot:4786853-Amphidinium_carterae.1
MSCGIVPLFLVLDVHVVKMFSTVLSGHVLFVMQIVGLLAHLDDRLSGLRSRSLSQTSSVVPIDVVLCP